MMVMKATMDDVRVRNFLNTKVPKIPEAANKGTFKHAKRIAKSIKTQLISETYKASRAKMGARIYAKKINKNSTGIMMPQKAIWLDSMKPHYVALKRGRLITRWAKKFYDYGGTIRKGFSRVRTGPKGGIRKGSKLFVTPHPFVDKGMSKVRNQAGITVLREINKLITS